MGIYTTFKDGVAREATFGSTAIANAAAPAYLFGEFAQDAIHPDPKTEVHYRTVGINTREVPQGERHKGVFDCQGFWGIALNNGVIFELIMAKSSTAGADPYTHTITTPTDGSLLPSFTVHHEAAGTATQWNTQYLGCKIMALTLAISVRDPFLIAGVDWLAREPVADPATLDDTPALWTTANNAPYTWQGMGTRTLAGAEITGISAVEFTINAGLVPIYTPRWDNSTYKGRFPYRFMEQPRRDYTLRMKVSPAFDDMWDAVLDTSTADTPDIVFKWTRAANDYIQMTLTDCDFIQHPQITPHLTEEYTAEIVCKPRSVSFEVKDSIAGGAYGE